MPATHRLLSHIRLKQPMSSIETGLMKVVRQLTAPLRPSVSTRMHDSFRVGKPGPGMSAMFATAAISIATRAMAAFRLSPPTTCLSGHDKIADIAPTEYTGAMRSPRGPFSKLLRRWSNQQESALHQLSEGKTVGQRLAGFGKSERVDAKILLLAIVPFVPVIVSDTLGWERGMVWNIWFWISVVWAATVFTVGLATYWRAFVQSIRRKR